MTPCNPDYYVIGDKCQKPTSLPDGWTSTTSNGYTSNIIATFNNLSTNESCAYECLDTKGCNVASFSIDSKQNAACTLYTQADKSDNKVSGTVITRPTKKTS